jgi:hypothetical protein
MMGNIQDGKMNDCCNTNTSSNKLEPTHQIVRYFNQYKHILFEKDASYVFLKPLGNKFVAYYLKCTLQYKNNLP